MARSTLSRIGSLRDLPVARLLAVSAVALATANCSSNPQKIAAGPAGNGIDPKYGVRASPRVYNEGDVIPKGGGRRFSGKPYVVAGKTYVPREDGRGYVREGLASWYGSAFHGRLTANGEVFDRASIAAAHPTLPLPSYVRVTNTANGHSMVVRVNDRGPYHAGRVLDVSEEVARALEFHRRGTTHVRVEYVGKASVAGSDDRRLLATLRTDGRPAGLRSNVMLADLGPSETEEAAPARAPLAFKPAREAEEEAPRPAPARAPVLLARASTPVPAALQPTAARAAPFRAAPVAVAAGKAPAGKGLAGKAAAPVQLARAEAGPGSKPGPGQKPAAGTRVAAAPELRLNGPQTGGAAMPASARLAMARLAAAPAPKAVPASAKEAAPAKSAAKATAVAGKAPAVQVAAKPVPGRRTDRLAGIY